MTRARHLIATVLVCCAALMGMASGWFAGLDAGLRDLRFSLTARPASGDIVFVEIDSQAVRDAGSLSGFRLLYARAIDVMVEEGAQVVVLDVPLRENLDNADDEALVGALERASGVVRTVATHVLTTDGETVTDFPRDHFAAAAPPVVVDTVVDGRAERYSTHFVHQGWAMDSLALALNPEAPMVAEHFLIDFSIAFETLPRTTLSAVLAGDHPSGFFEGRRVLLGHASYTQLSSHAVPRYGMLATPPLQLLAAETIAQDRMLTQTGPVVAMIVILAGGLLFIAFRPRMSLGSAVAGSLAYAGILEFFAIGFLAYSGMLVDTAGIHVAQAGFLVAAFWHELEQRGRSLTRTARERDSTRGILTRVIADNFDGVVIADQAGIIRVASRMAEELIGRPLVGAPVAGTLPDPFARALEDALARGRIMEKVHEDTVSCGGGPRIVEFVVTLSDMGGAGQGTGTAARVACLTFRDITARRQAEERLTYLAEHDALTGAVCRSKFLKDIEALLDTPSARVKGVGVYLVGLSRLKTINDTLGHAYGDELLRQVMGRLHLLGPASIARLEGNAFAVLRPGLLNGDAQGGFAEKLIAEISRPYYLDGHHAIVGARVGMTDSDLSGSVPDALVSHAGLALSMAADGPDNSALVFSRDMDARIKTKQDMEVALRAALAKGEFSVHYQPQVDLETGEIVGVEALARWTHPELGNVSPARFIPAAEETGLIIDLGRFVLETACKEVASWPRPIRLSVNVSPLQFEYGDIEGDVRSALSEAGLAPDRLDIEITESLLVSDVCPAIDTLKSLRALGVHVALDDFGTGYSSLSYLGRLPVDTIKIDQSFVRCLPEDVEASAIVRTVLMLSDSLGKSVIAEGIETQDQAWLLRLAGCKVGQGYFFSRPGPAHAILALLLEAEDDALPAMRMG